MAANDYAPSDTLKRMLLEAAYDAPIGGNNDTAYILANYGVVLSAYFQSKELAGVLMAYTMASAATLTGSSRADILAKYLRKKISGKAAAMPYGTLQRPTARCPNPPLASAGEKVSKRRDCHGRIFSRSGCPKARAWRQGSRHSIFMIAKAEQPLVRSH